MVLAARYPAGSLNFKNGFAENFLKWVKTKYDYLRFNRSQNYADELSTADPASGQSGTGDSDRSMAVLPFAGNGAHAKGLTLKSKSL